MSKIFGLSDLPISTIESALRGTVYEPPKIYPSKPQLRQGFHNTPIKPVAQNKKVISNGVVKMRNGIGKLMQHFSKKVK